MEPPKYVEKESINDYLRKVDVYKLYLKKHEYNDILLFLNKLLNLREECYFKSLLEFKKISHNDIFKNKDFLLNFLKKNGNTFKKKYGVGFKINIFYNKNKMNNIYLLNFINNLLTKIRYLLIEYESNKIKYYKIMQK